MGKTARMPGVPVKRSLTLLETVIGVVLIASIAGTVSVMLGRSLPEGRVLSKEIVARNVCRQRLEELRALPLSGAPFNAIPLAAGWTVLQSQGIGAIPLYPDFTRTDEATWDVDLNGTLDAGIEDQRNLVLIRVEVWWDADGNGVINDGSSILMPTDRSVELYTMKTTY